MRVPSALLNSHVVLQTNRNRRRTTAGTLMKHIVPSIAWLSGVDMYIHMTLARLDLLTGRDEGTH